MTKTSLQPVAKSSNGTPLFECVCPDCGKVRIQDKRKIGIPCMPCSRKRRATHGMSNDPAYRLLCGMKARCKYPSSTNYKYYGGKGIKVCDAWLKDPLVFIQWAYAQGYRPGLEIDRIDADKGYCPENCRFVDHITNCQRNSKSKITIDEASKVKALLKNGFSVTRAAQHQGIPYMTVWHISKGNTWLNA